MSVSRIISELGRRLILFRTCTLSKEHLELAFLRRLLGRKPGRRVVLVTPPSYFTETMMRMPTYLSLSSRS